ncbi:MAG TPA: ATP-binding protein [Thermoplasmata archaeon]|nr:ATP-binding protein [Thermoplasmata archaeon]
MPATSSPVLRAIQGLAENSGRTLVIAGPPASGKTAVLEELKELLKSQGARIVELQGSYRGRSVPYGGLTGLRPEPATAALGAVASSDPGVAVDENGDESLPLAVGPVVPYYSERLPRSRRSRGGARSTFLGQPVRGRPANEGNPGAYWREILPEFRGEGRHSVAILIEDAALFDTESRDFIVTLSQRARFRPLLIAITLDTSVPGYMPWEQAFSGRGDIDWVRFSTSAPDPREAHRLKAIWDDLPAVTQRVAGYVALLGGTSGEVVLSRVARLNFPQLAEAVLPATGVGLLKVQDGKVTIPHLAWISLCVDQLVEAQRKEMHLDIANALVALSHEPNFARRVEVARHYLSWYPGPMALRYLLEAAELGLEFFAYDTAEELLAESIGCLGTLPPTERDPLEPELRFLHAEALFCSGRVVEAETEMREGVDRAVQAGLSGGTIAEWLEPLILAMRVVGPRPSLSTTLVELAERCHEADLVEVEVLLEAMIAEFHYERNLRDEAREETHRAARLARKLPDGHLQAVALLAVGMSRVEGTPEEQELAAKFLRAARTLLGRARRWELDYLAEDVESRLFEARGDSNRAKELRERSLPGVQRAKLLTIELYHQLGIAEILLDRGTAKGVDAALARARSISETLHLIPPSPGLLRLWLLEGRYHAINDAFDEARDRWEALIDEPPGDSIPRLRAEATVRLALMAYAQQRSEDALELVQRLNDPAVLSALPAGYEKWIDDLERRAPHSDHGGSALPPMPHGLERAEKGERGERARH